MKTLAFVIGLAASIGANAAVIIPEAVPARVEPRMIEPAVPSGTAAPAPQVLPEAAAAKASVAPSADVGTVATAASARISVGDIGEAPLCETSGVKSSVTVAETPPSAVAEARRLGDLPEPREFIGCSLAGVYERDRFLSGPWSAYRRLKAARVRGDEDEVLRIRAMMDDFIVESLGAEDIGP